MSDALLSLGEASVELGEKRLQLVFRSPSTGAIQATYVLPDARSIDRLRWLLELAKHAASIDNHLGNLTARVAEIEFKLRALEGHADKHDDFGRRWMCSAETLAGHRPDGDGNAH